MAYSKPRHRSPANRTVLTSGAVAKGRRRGERPEASFSQIMELMKRRADARADERREAIPGADVEIGVRQNIIALDRRVVGIAAKKAAVVEVFPRWNNALMSDIPPSRRRGTNC